MMPLYGFVCEECSEQVDIFCSYEQKRNQRCACGNTLSPLLSTLRKVGPTPTRPSNAGGKRIESPSEERRWQAENPGLRLMSKNDGYVRAQKEKVRQMAETRAVKGGWTSEGARQEWVRREAKKKGEKIGT